MYARLWWKDARQFWPIWVVLLVAAAATQWLMLSFVGRPVRFGALGISALLWAGLYALAAGAAAFAGERETGTLHLLDVLPADRRVVWAGKFSFAFVTTLILTVALLAMAALSTERWNPQNQNPLTPLDAIGLSMFVLVALGWGLLWSSVLKTALAAALAGMCCIGLTLAILARDVDFIMGGRAPIAGPVGLALLAVIIMTVAASDFFFTGTRRVRRMSFQLRSPVVFTGSRSTRIRRIPTLVPVAAVPAPSPRPIGVMRGPQAPTAARLGRRSRLIEARSLVWQTIKEGMKTWSMLAAITVVVPALLYVYLDDHLDDVWLMIIGSVIVLAAGASGFGLENRARTYRFLVHHGAQTGLVWLVKVTTWALGLAIIAVAMAVIVRITAAGGSSHQNLTPAVLCLPLGYAVAVICGMAFRRGITAFVIALVLTLGLAALLLTLVFMNLLPAPGILVVSAALLVISWAWRGDWMLERPAPGRWLRLGLFATVAFALLAACHIGFRVWSVPDVGPIAPPAVWADASSILAATERNAAPLYTEAGRRLIIRENWRESLRENELALDLVRRAAARPDCRFDRPDKPTLRDRLDLPPVVVLSKLVNQEALNRLERGDLTGSWDDILVLFRMTRQFVEGSGVDMAQSAVVAVERDALSLALDWAVAPGQTAERLHAALEAYRNLPKMPPPSDVVRAEANLVENTLNLPASALRNYLAEFLFGPSASGRPGDNRQILAIGKINLVTTPWELAHARRVNRLVSTEALQVATLEPGDRMAHWQHQAVSDVWTTLPDPLSTLSRPAREYLFADGQNEVARRALVQILAIRSWQLKHDGRIPDRLDALVPDELPSLPNDPYSDRRFGYRRWHGLSLIPLRSALPWSLMLFVSDSELISPQPGSWLLYSVGPDRQDNGGIADTKTFPGRDLVFAIPPLRKNTSGAGKDKGESTPKASSEPRK